MGAGCELADGSEVLSAFAFIEPIKTLTRILHWLTPLFVNE